MSKVELSFYGNLSWSAYNLFKNCERHFFYEKILKCPITDRPETKWGRFGNCVHEVLEHCKLDGSDVDELLDKYWESFRLYETDMSKDIAKSCVVTGLSYNLDIKHRERVLLFRWHGMQVKMIIDVEEKDGSIVDWKTSTFDSKKVQEYRKQLMWYAWGVWKETGKIPPKIKVAFVKYPKKDLFEWSFTEAELLELEKSIEENLIRLNNKVQFDDYKPNYSSCFFCTFKKQCNKDDLQKSDDLVFDIRVDHDNVKILNTITDPIFHTSLDEYFSYELDGAYFVKKAMMAKGVKNFSPIKRFYKKQTLPIGFYSKLKELLKQYADFKGKRLIIKENDVRIFPDESFQFKLSLPYELRKYQSDAAEYMKQNKICITEIATGAGKTTIAAKLIEKLQKRTLFIVDRNILLSQTKTEFEKFFGIEIGTVTEGKQDWKEITIASIQSITSLLKKKDETCIKYLNAIQLLIVDEAHGSKSKSYINMMKYTGAEYRVALTGTAYSDGNDSLELYKSFGFPDYKITAKELIELGYLVKPEINFLSYDEGFIINGDYNEVYDQILKSEERLSCVDALHTKHHNNNMLIMVDRIEHVEMIQDLLPKTFIIQGSTSKKNRDIIIDKLKTSKNNVLIATSQIIQKGVDIPTLDVIVNYSANLGTIKTVQSLGRVLRKSEGKTKAWYYDFDDKHRVLKKHTKARKDALIKQGYEVE